MAHAKKNKNKAANVVADKQQSPVTAAQAVKKTVDTAAESTLKSVKAATDTAVKNTETAVKATPVATAHSTPRLSAIESNVATPDQLVHAGTEAARDFLAAGTLEAQKTQEKVLSISRESIETLSKSADQTARGVAEAVAATKEQVDALVESGKIAGDLGRDLQEKMVTEINELFAENVELSKELLACRTLNDLVEIQNRAFQSNLSRFFDSSSRMTDAWFKMATQASEPIGAQATQLTTRLGKTFAA